MIRSLVRSCARRRMPRAIFVFLVILDLIYGSAGEGLFYLRLHAATQDARWLRAAERRADWLLAHAVADGAGLKWALATSGRYATVFYVGMSHGTAGIGWFLTGLAETDGSARYLDAARRAATWLRAVAQE